MSVFRKAIAPGITSNAWDVKIILEIALTRISFSVMAF